jgi:hypothetical protein
VLHATIANKLGIKTAEELAKEEVERKKKEREDTRSLMWGK